MNHEGQKSRADVHGATKSATMSSDENLRIRRFLTLYLASLIAFPDKQPSHFQLCHPETALDVQSIPTEVVGLRRQYLKEIQANIKARQDLLASKKSDGGSVTTDG